MSRTLSVLSLGCVAAIGATAYGMLSADDPAPIAVPGIGDARPPVEASAEAEDPNGMQFALEQARRACTREALDELVVKLRHRAAEMPKDKDTWRRLAEGLLKRVQQHAHLIGMRPGRPIYKELPAVVTVDLDAAQEAIANAHQLGDDSGDLFRIEAELMSQRITGLFSALQWNGKIEAAIEAAGKRAQQDPKLHLVLGLRKLMAPELLGHDPEKALEHFTYAASALPTDERPALFAAMAHHLKKRRLEAIAWLKRAVERNPDNVFARVVLHRVRRGEATPFERDVTSAEALASAPEPGK